LSYRSIDTERDSAVAYETDSPGGELVGRLLALFAPINATPDPINRGEPITGATNRRHKASSSDSDTVLAALSDVPAAKMPAIAHLSNASILQVTRPNGRLAIYTLVRNRRHSNVAFLLGESLRYEPEKDTLTIVPGVATLYPNFIFTVPDDEVSAFAAALADEALGDRAAFVKHVVAVWGVRRSSPEFWSRFHAINRYQYDVDPVEAGILDLNRYVDF
jgi:hypothetical protein